MADIRQTSAFIDDFNRADENPLAGGWAKTDNALWTYGLVLKSNSATHNTLDTIGDSYWTAESFSGDDAEFWGYQVGGGASGIAWGISLWHEPGGTGTLDGYRFRYERAAANARWRIYLYTNAGSSVIYDSGPVSSNPIFTNGAGLLLIRRKGNDVEGWGAAQADPTTWTRYAVVTESTYTTNLYFGLGISDNSSSQLLGWDNPGGGPASTWMPEFIRRPWEYAGHRLTP